jgi:uncharacterized protein YgbK (DUF1537 family)
MGAARANFGYGDPVLHADRRTSRPDGDRIMLNLDKILKQTQANWDKELRRKVSGAFKMFGTGSNSGMYDLGVKISTSIYNKAAAEFVESRLPKITGPVSATTKEKVASLIRKGIEKGASIQDTAKGVKNLFDEMSGYRSELIAQVETGIGASTGDFMNASMTELDLMKIWSTAEDDKVRESHEEVNDTAVDMDELFANDMLFPLWEDGPIEEIANCRCCVLYVPRDELDQWI